MLASYLPFAFLKPGLRALNKDSLGGCIILFLHTDLIFMLFKVVSVIVLTCPFFSVQKFIVNISRQTEHCGGIKV